MWTGSASTSWSNSTNWDGGIIPGGAAGDIARFTSGTPNFSTVNVDLPGYLLGEIDFSGTSYSIQGNDFTLDNSPSTQSFILEFSSGNHSTISSNLHFSQLISVGNPSTDSSLSISGKIDGAGGINWNGLGTFLLSGPNSYSGSTTFNSGIIETLSSTALGTGDVFNITGTLLNLGLTALTVGGNYTQDAASTLEIGINGSVSGSLNVLGAATIPANSTMILNVINYVPNQTSFSLVTAGLPSSIGTPNIVVTGNTKVTFNVTSVGNNLVLDSSNNQNGFVSVSTNSNSAAVATVLDNIPNPQGDMLTVLNALSNLGNAQAAAALNTLYTQIDSGVVNTASAVGAANLIGVSTNRLNSVFLPLAQFIGAGTTVRGGTKPGHLAYAAGQKKEGSLEDCKRHISHCVWTQGSGSLISQGVRNHSVGYKADCKGLALGTDRLEDNILLGICGGYSYATVISQSALLRSTQINSLQTALYGGYSEPKNPLFFYLLGYFNYNWYLSRRQIVIGPTIHRLARGLYEGEQYGIATDIGYKMMSKGYLIAPIFSMYWNRLDVDSYTETGADSINLSIRRQNYTQLLSALGVRINSSKPYSWGTFITGARARWVHDYIGAPMAVTSNFTGGGVAFGTLGAHPALNSALIGGELMFAFKNGVIVSANCETETKEKFFGVYGSLTLSYEF